MKKITLKDKYAILEERIRRLSEIGLALSREDDTNVIFELIMEEAKNITQADGRTLYMKSDDSIYHCDDKEWGYYPNGSPKRILYMFHNDCDRIIVEVSFEEDTYFD